MFQVWNAQIYMWCCKDFVTIPIFPFLPLNKQQHAVSQSNTLKIADIINYMASSKPIASVYTSANLYIFFAWRQCIRRVCLGCAYFLFRWAEKKNAACVCMCCAYGAKIYVMEINVNKMKNQAHVRITWVRICCMAIIWKRTHTHAYTRISYTLSHTLYTCTAHRRRSIYRDNNNGTKKDASWCFKLLSKVNKVDIYTLGRIEK